MTRRLTSRLKESGDTLAVAESCTGGRLAAAFTARAGASDYFLGGVVAYSNDVKENVLGVDAATLAAHGAVSRQVAEAMAVGVLRLTGADHSISTTGIAGPGGGSPEKPVGTVWIAVAGRREREYMGTDSDTGERASADAGERAVSGASGSTFVLEAHLFHFTGSREEIMNQSVEAAIELLIGIL